MTALDAPKTIGNAHHYARAYDKALSDVINFFSQPMKEYIQYREDTDQHTDDQRICDWTFSHISNSGFVFNGESCNDNHHRTLTLPYAFFEDRPAYDKGAAHCREQKAAEAERLRKARLRAQLETAKAQVEALIEALNK